MKKYFLWILFFANLAVIVTFWWLGSGAYVTGSVAQIFIAAGRLAGLLGEFLILTQLVLIGRIQPLERMYGFDKLNQYHRKIGWFVLGVLVFHPIALSLGYGALSAGSFSFGSAWAQFLTFLFTWNDVFLAFLALLLLIVIVGISLAIIRKKLRYETWYFVHVLVYVAIGLAFSHQIQTADVSAGAALYYWLVLNFVVFGLVLVYRFGRPLWLFWRHRFYIEQVVQETPTVWSVYIAGKNMEKFYFDAGQYANLTFLAKDNWYTHPFSFSAAENGATLRFSMKGVGDFTNEVPRLRLRTKVIVDGPLGGFTLRHAKAKTGKFLFLAGGIGVTPIRALVEDLKKGGVADAKVLFAARTESELAFQKEFNALGMPVTAFLSDERLPGYEAGFINRAALERLVPDILMRDIYVCGPIPMLAMTLAELKALGVPRSHIHYEIFAY